MASDPEVAPGTADERIPIDYALIAAGKPASAGTSRAETRARETRSREPR